MMIIVLNANVKYFFMKKINFFFIKNKANYYAVTIAQDRFI